MPDETLQAFREVVPSSWTLYQEAPGRFYQYRSPNKQYNAILKTTGGIDYWHVSVSARDPRDGSPRPVAQDDVPHIGAAQEFFMKHIPRVVGDSSEPPEKGLFDDLF